MVKFVWSIDKSNNEWPDIVYEKLSNKDIKPGNLTSVDKLEFVCVTHGAFLKRISNIYYEINTFGYPICPKCSRVEATKKVEKTNLERYGTKAPAQNSKVLDKMKATNKERYGFDSVGSNPQFMDKIKQTNLERYGFEHGILHPEVKEKANQTMIKKYGAIHALQNKKSFDKFKNTMNDKYDSDFSLQNKDIREKFTNTMKEKYNTKHALQNEEFKEKMRDTNMNNYGVEYASQNNDIKEKIKDTSLKKYGFDNPMKNSKVLNSFKESIKNKYGKEYPFQNYEIYLKMCNTNNKNPVTEEIFEIFNNKELFSEYLDKLTNENGTKPTIIQIAELTGYNRPGVSNRIIRFELQDKVHYLSGESHYEHEIMEFLDQFSISYKHRYTKLGPEIDIYIPDHDIGIEFNGLYWHSDEFKNKSYHLDKTRYYKEIGTKIIHIYEDEWNDENKQKILKSIILSACNIAVNKTIDYARKLKLVDLDHSSFTLEKIRSFYNENHLQGYRNSSAHIALLDENDDIIECMSFGYAYFGNMKNKSKYQYELIRHCTKMYHNVVGGKERIFKYFITNYPYDNKFDNYIITYCDIDKFSGISYEKLRFKYIDHKIQVWGIEDTYTKRVFRDPSDNDHFKILPKIYGCGNNVYIYNY